MMWVNHDAGFSTRSLHLVNNFAPVVGQRVAERQVLGTMGNTGAPGGTHLHLEVVVNGTQIAPVPFITDRLNNPPLKEQEGFAARVGDI